MLLHKRLKSFGEQEEGVTLVELLVVIAIMAILVAVVVPNFLGVFSGATTQTQASEARTVQTIVDVYMASQGVSTVTATTITPANYTSGVYASYFRTAPKCSYSVAASGAVTQTSCP